MMLNLVAAFKIVYMLLSAGSICISLLLGYWFFIDPKPLEIYSAVAVDPDVKRGEFVIIAIDAEKFRSDCYGESSHQIKDSTATVFRADGPQAGWARVTDGPQQFRYAVRIPWDIAVGPAAYWQSIDYRCNPIRVDHYLTPEIHMNVLP